MLFHFYCFASEKAHNFQGQHAHLCVQLLCGLSPLTNTLLSFHSLPVKPWTETKYPIYNLKYKAKGTEYSQQNAKLVLKNIYEITLSEANHLFIGGGGDETI